MLLAFSFCEVIEIYDYTKTVIKNKFCERYFSLFLFGINLNKNNICTIKPKAKQKS
jgi:hypothetical protein